MTKLATKTHKDRVNEFNSKLEALSEHHDIPKVCSSSFCFISDMLRAITGWTGLISRTLRRITVSCWNIRIFSDLGSMGLCEQCSRVLFRFSIVCTRSVRRKRVCTKLREM